MYLYLYDSFLNDKRFAQTLAKIETRLTDLGIGGKIYRLSPLRNVEELISDEVKAGVTNIIVVGNDKTLSQVVNVAAKHEVALGLMPLGPENQIAQALGIPEGEGACDIVAARIVKRVDLGRINNLYFLSGVKIFSSEVTLECEELYSISSKLKNALITICNSRPATAQLAATANYFNPQDGFLEVFIQPEKTGFFNIFKRPDRQKTIIPFKKLAIKSKSSVPVVTDGQRVLKTPVKIEVIPKKLKLIVGKNRNF